MLNREDTHEGLPSENVGVKAKVVLRDVDATLEEDVTLEGTRVVDNQPLVGRQILEDALKVLATRTVRRIQHLVPVHSQQQQQQI